MWKTFYWFSTGASNHPRNFKLFADFQNQQVLIIMYSAFPLSLSKDIWRDCYLFLLSLANPLGLLDVTGKGINCHWALIIDSFRCPDIEIRLIPCPNLILNLKFFDVQRLLIISYLVPLISSKNQQHSDFLMVSHHLKLSLFNTSKFGLSSIV